MRHLSTATSFREQSGRVSPRWPESSQVASSRSRTVRSRSFRLPLSLGAPLLGLAWALTPGVPASLCHAGAENPGQALKASRPELFSTGPSVSEADSEQKGPLAPAPDPPSPSTASPKPPSGAGSTTGILKPASTGAAGPDGAAAPAPSTAPVPPPAPPSAPPRSRGDREVPVIQDGTLKNAVHRFRFPVPLGWTLTSESTSNEMIFTTPSCGDCFLRILVTTLESGSANAEAGTLQGAVKAIKEHIASDPASRILGEEEIKVAKKDAYTIIKEEPDAANPTEGAAKNDSGGHVIKTRFVTFNNGGDRYYLLLKSPGNRFPADDTKFETLLAKFRFDS